jgi:hypothetical protein
MFKPQLSNPIERIGFLLALSGGLLAIVGFFSSLPHLDQPPNRSEFNAAASARWAAEQEQLRLERIRKEMAYPNLPIRPSSGVELHTELEPEWEPLPTRDPLARWTASTYSRKTLDNLSESFTNPQSWQQFAFSFGTKSLFVGLFLWLLFERTITRLYKWIRHGKSAH